MNGLTIAGIVVMFVGGLLISDHKGMGMSDPAIGILVAGGGFLLTCYGYFSGNTTANEGGPRKKVKDYSV